MDESFDFGLQRVLDGMELYIDARKTPAAQRARRKAESA
jgi:hypothetical protein